MNIYLLSQDINTGYSTHDSCVVIANTEEEARSIHPSEFVTHVTDDRWMGTYAGDPTWELHGKEYYSSSFAKEWVPYSRISEIKVELIGTTEETEERCVLASYNAG